MRMFKGYIDWFSQCHCCYHEHKITKSEDPLGTWASCKCKESREKLASVDLESSDTVYNYHKLMATKCTMHTAGLCSCICTQLVSLSRLRSLTRMSKLHNNADAGVYAYLYSTLVSKAFAKTRNWWLSLKLLILELLLLIWLAHHNKCSSMVQ